jgi:hypothetical protein
MNELKAGRKVGCHKAAVEFFGTGVASEKLGNVPSARFCLEWGRSDLLNSVIPTGTDHRKAMICGVEGPAVVTSAVNLHNAVTVSQQRLGKRVAQLSSARMNEVCAAPRFSLACDSN